VAEAEAALEQRVSLALWRMDTELAPIVAEEVVRPPSAYRATFMVAEDSGPPAFTQQQAVQQPVHASAGSLPPALEPPPYVLLQCEARPDGTWHSPQVPDVQSRGLQTDTGFADDVVAKRADQLADLASAVKLPELLAKLPDTPLPTAAEAGSNFLAQHSAQTADELNQLERQVKFFEGNRAISPTKQPPATAEFATPFGKNAPPPSGKGQQITKQADFEQREQRYQSRAQQNLFNQRQQGFVANSAASNAGPNVDGFVPGAQVGVSRPVWIGERLLLARRVTWNGETLVQGCWLDWPQIKKRLLAESTDLLPDADLVPVKGDAAADPGRMLAGLPVRLLVGEAAVLGTIGPALRWSLWMGWGAVGLATAAAAVLLNGVMTLSERRAAFVSSVTHELRTPLTTFRMYAEMLARGMVPDAERRQEYFNTLQREAERLTLLVENVLAYARLERGRKPQAVECVTLKGLMDRIQPRLAHRAEQADMQCVVQVAPDAADFEFATDLNVAEQILFNLVDNSAKYAREATDRRIHVEATRDGTWMRLAVRDHGPGISHARSSRRMQAFGKSAQESADTAPGVGLGLALCRRLARQLGGRLEIASTVDDGAIVSLLLPANGTGVVACNERRDS
jgi:signal transduction histidine kinase